MVEFEVTKYRMKWKVTSRRLEIFSGMSVGGGAVRAEGVWAHIGSL